MKAFIKMIDEMTGATIKIHCEIDVMPKDNLFCVQTYNITTFEIEADYGQSKTESENN